MRITLLLLGLLVIAGVGWLTLVSWSLNSTTKRASEHRDLPPVALSKKDPEQRLSWSLPWPATTLTFEVRGLDAQGHLVIALEKRNGGPATVRVRGADIYADDLIFSLDQGRSQTVFEGSVEAARYLQLSYRANSPSDLELLFYWRDPTGQSEGVTILTTSTWQIDRW